MKGHGQTFVVWEKVSATKNGKDKDNDKYNEKVNICHERTKTGDCGQQWSSVSPESGPGFEFSAGAGSGSRILDPDWVSDFGNH